jgi:D-lactate dehydrogenase
VLRLADRAGVRLLVPAGIERVCCGTPWSSKGLDRGYEAMRARVQELVFDRNLPVVIDSTSCTEGFRRLLPDAGVVDAVAYVADELLPRLTVHRRLPSLAVHPTCSSTRLGINDALMRVAAAIADEVVVPEGWGCCGFAGDRGMLHPELTASATRTEAEGLTGRSFAAYASANRPCEIAMTRATGHVYRHILELVDNATS